ncbi:putative GDSL-like Lipase/Acylhydrolase family protein [Hibiscus syriacus]|uniref:GDSL-like Lipase/Acylhydrolase family protein n=1 Tax=Hibiscus syriacus TaxID=106335 RepID=A0A6A3CK28_HIBSY|nr:putative GDSL-like Lipase/Acylhydrolase family protein [Hibiscus syriacus]
MPLTTLFFVMLLQIGIGTCGTPTRPVSVPNFTSILVFGDSTVDTGNNNFIDTVFKANHLPYGQDFPGHSPTGRFSNGKLIPDFVASFLGIKQTVPPSLDPNLSNDDLRTGVSFASAGSGYDELTTVLTGAIPVPKQLDQFKSYIAKLSRIFGNNEARNIIEKSLAIISAGTNDFGFNYYLLPMRKQRQSWLSSFSAKNITRLRQGLPPMGCVPILTTERLKPPFYRACLEDENTDAQSYNEKLVKLLPLLQTTLPGTDIVYADIYTPLLDIMTNPQKYGTHTHTNEVELVYGKEIEDHLWVQVSQRPKMDAAGVDYLKLHFCAIQRLQFVKSLGSSCFGTAFIQARQLTKQRLICW